MTFNSSQQERLLAALERIADALEARVRSTRASGLAGRCGAPAPDPLAVSCDLGAGHSGQHQGRSYPPGLLSAGIPIHWTTDTDPQTTKGPYR